MTILKTGLNQTQPIFMFVSYVLDSRSDGYQQFEDNVNNIDVNSSYSSVSGSYLNTNETSKLEENIFASTSNQTSSNATSYSNF
ncbi:33074_t:CDS:2, partial [Gigaspora margarita]